MKCAFIPGVVDWTGKTIKSPAGYVVLLENHFRKGRWYWHAVILFLKKYPVGFYEYIKKAEFLEWGGEGKHVDRLNQEGVGWDRPLTIKLDPNPQPSQSYTGY